MMYTVHVMKRVSATEARKNFFRLLDHAAGGAAVLIERKGTLLRLVREKLKHKKTTPDYRKFIKGPVEQADTWSWEWHPQQGLLPKDRLTG